MRMVSQKELEMLWGILQSKVPEVKPDFIPLLSVL